MRSPSPQRTTGANALHNWRLRGEAREPGDTSAGTLARELVSWRGGSQHILHCPWLSQHSALCLRRNRLRSEKHRTPQSGMQSTVLQRTIQSAQYGANHFWLTLSNMAD